MQQSKDKTVTRQYNYDLLRIISCIAVVMIHVSTTYKSAYTNETDPYRIHVAATVIYNTLSRFAVPCFMMLSGALLLSNDKNRDFRFFYRKSFINIGIPTIIFSIIYFLGSLAIAVAKIVIKGSSFTVLIKPIKSMIEGAPFYHMWYLYTLIGVYFFIPIILRVKSDISEKSFTIASWIFFVVASVSGFTSTFKLHWGVAKVICYVGYILIGYQINKSISKKNNVKGILCILLAIVLLLLQSYVQYGHTIALITEENEPYPIIGNFNPVIMLAAIFIFIGFTCLSINCDKLQRLSTDTFEIYLFHAGVWSVMSGVLFKLAGGMTDPIYTIPLGIIFVFLLSWALCPIYKKIWNMVNKNNRLTDKLCKLLHM